jgi:hypothetical protein
MLDFSKIKTYPINKWEHKVKIDNLAKLNSEFAEINSPEFNELCEKIKTAKQNNKRIILMIGGHVIKTGMNLYIIDLIKRGFINHIAGNGAISIHDFELAYAGETSEYVEKTIENGSFGFKEETGGIMNRIIKEAAENNKGYGFYLGKKIAESDYKYKDYSLFANAFNLDIPITVHVAIGTDIIHQHPSCNGAAIGKTSYLDFKIFVDSISKLEGGVIINIGSAVIMPEVFLKALTIVRNLGFEIKDFTAINFDMFKHYRPYENVCKRPTSLGGKYYYIVEKHEKTIPSLYHKLVR